jgi:hypothetical protein
VSALVYRSPAKNPLAEMPVPVLSEMTDAVTRIIHATICGTNLQTLTFNLTEILNTYDT